MKVVAISDLHGNLIDDIPEFDLLLICGDLCPTSCHGRKFQEDWLNQEFVPWLNTMPYKDSWSKVIFIAGNHDFFLESKGKDKLKMHNMFTMATNGRAVYLHNETTTFQYLGANGIEEYTIFGTPYCKIFGNWAFMRQSESLVTYYDKMPHNADIVITHDAPQLCGLGVIHQSMKQTDAGNGILASVVMSRKPRYLFCGHIHSGTHNLVTYEETQMANVSILDEFYTPEFKPFEIDITKTKIE
jgi:Icc-related predicted phosphoesterase